MTIAASTDDEETRVDTNSDNMGSAYPESGSGDVCPCASAPRVAPAFGCEVVG